MDKYKKSDVNEIENMDRSVRGDRSIEILYKIGLLLIVPLIIVFLFLRTDKAVELLMTDSRMCSIKRVTGLDCPGCGGTRAVLYLARFRIIDSFKMNASVIVGLALYLYFMIKETFHKLLKTKGICEVELYVLIGIFALTVVIKWIVSNYI